MARSIQGTVAMVLALVVAIFTIGADSEKLFGSCGINLSGFQSCLPPVATPHASVSISCCKIFKSVDLSCMCMFKSGLPKMGIDPFFMSNIATGCYISPPVFCFV